MTRADRNFSRGFTLMEMMVAIALVVLIITGVGILTQSMGKMVSTSQASNEMLSNVRAVQYQLETDLNGLDRNAFLVIRSNADPSTGKRFDMLSFVASGAFPNRTGNDLTANVAPNYIGLFADSTVANAALIWYGHAFLEVSNPPASGNYMALSELRTGPNGVYSANGTPSGIDDQDFILCRRAMLLMSAAGTSAVGTSQRIAFVNQSGVTVNIAAYASPDLANVTKVKGSTNVDDAFGADITSSRIAVCAMTPSQLMMKVAIGAGIPRASSMYEATNYCYRLHVVQDVYGDKNNYPIDYIRTTPQLLQGCSGFSVEWSDGSTDTGTASGNLLWYGLNSGKGDGVVEGTAGGDGYTAQFSFDSKPKWPKALRIQYHVADRNNRLPGGRDFSHVVRLPT